MYEFIQVTARKGNDFAASSNLSFMDHQRLSPAGAERALKEMAGEYAAKGYSIEWIREELNKDELPFYAPLFQHAGE